MQIYNKDNDTLQCLNRTHKLAVNVQQKVINIQNILDNSFLPADNNSVKVAQHGGDFQDIQAAIDSVKYGNNKGK